MKTRLIAAIAALLAVMPASAQNELSDSLKQEIDGITLLNGSMKPTIDKYKKNAKKGNLDAAAALGVECLNGKNVKSNLTLGLDLLETAAKGGNVEGAYQLGSMYFLFWAKNPDNTTYFKAGTRWLKNAVNANDNRALGVLGKFYMEFGKYNDETAYIDGAIKLMEGMDGIGMVNNTDNNILKAQAILGTANLAKWRMSQDTTALRNAKRWYQTLLKSDLEFPDYTPYVDSLQFVLSMGVPMRIDPMPDPDAEQPQAQGGFPGMGGFGGGFGGGFPGMGGGGAPQAPAGPQATFPGGNWQMQQFISRNTNYPKSLEDAKVKGSVTVSFTIDTDGAVVNPEISKSSDVHIMDKEALRTIMIMPDWTPAEQDGKPVQARHTANVNFGTGGGMGGFGGFGF